jgi:hypothetical protein
MILFLAIHGFELFLHYRQTIYQNHEIQVYDPIDHDVFFNQREGIKRANPAVPS